MAFDQTWLVSEGVLGLGFGWVCTLLVWAGRGAGGRSDWRAPTALRGVGGAWEFAVGKKPHLLLAVKPQGGLGAALHGVAGGGPARHGVGPLLERVEAAGRRLVGESRGVGKGWEQVGSGEVEVAAGWAAGGAGGCTSAAASQQASAGSHVPLGRVGHARAPGGHDVGAAREDARRRLGRRAAELGRGDGAGGGDGEAVGPLPAGGGWRLAVSRLAVGRARSSGGRLRARCSLSCECSHRLRVVVLVAGRRWDVGVHF
jgi:hypothetical protein